MIRGPLISLLALLLSAGCHGPAGDTAGAPSTGQEEPAARRLLEPPKAVLPDGFAVRLELALTPEERARGLMFRPSLQPDHGMLFLFDRPARWPFWMKDTWIALDLVFLDAHGTVTEVIPDVPPCRAEPCPQYVPEKDASAVLELPAGTAAAHGVVPGAAITFTRVPDYPAS